MTMHCIKQVFRQEPHCCADIDADPTLELELMDGGGGEYLVIRAAEWAVDDDKELAGMMKVLKDMLATAVKEVPK